MSSGLFKNNVTRELFICESVPPHWSSGYSVRQWSGRPEFNPMSRHTKGFKMALDTS